MIRYDALLLFFHSQTFVLLQDWHAYDLAPFLLLGVFGVSPIFPIFLLI